MSLVLNEKKRVCNILTNGPIAELGFITGPAYGCRLTTNTIVKLVSNGRKVYEVDPSGKNEPVLLTVATCGESVFGKLSTENRKNKEPDTIPVTEIPKKVVTTASQNDGKHLSKSERKRLKYQQSYDVQDQNVTKQIDTQSKEDNNDKAKVEETVTQVTETTPTDHIEKNKVVDATKPVEEAVISADIQ